MTQPSDRSPHWYWSGSHGLGASLWRAKWLLLAVAVVFATAGYLFADLRSRTYTADAVLTLTDPRGTFQQEVLQLSRDPVRHLRNEAERMESRVVAERASELLDGKVTADQVAATTSAAPIADRDVVVIRATTSAPELSRDVANALAEAYQLVSAENAAARVEAAAREVEVLKASLGDRRDALQAALSDDPANQSALTELASVNNELTATDSRLQQLSIDLALFGAGVQLVDPAPLPEGPADAGSVLFGAGAAAVGLFLAGAFVWWRDEATPTAVDRHDPGPILQAPLLGVIPRHATHGPGLSLPTAHEPRSLEAEAYQFVMSSLSFVLEERNASVVVVTSAQSGDGKTTTTLNLAAAAVTGGTKPLVVDADERKRDLSRHVADHLAGPGLVDLARSSTLSVEECVRRWSPSEDVSFEVIPAGAERADSAGFFRTHQVHDALARIRARGSVTLIDCPPVLGAAETSDIAAETDGVVLVVAHGTPLVAVHDAHDYLAQTGIPLLGYVFNRARSHHNGYYVHETSRGRWGLRWPRMSGRDG